jgi:hypothetical protein
VKNDRQARIAERMVKMAAGHKWELLTVNEMDLEMAAVWNSGRIAMPVEQIARETDTIGNKAYREMMELPGLGIPISNSSVKPYLPMVFTEEGRIKVRIMYQAKWSLRTAVPKWDDVEEILAKGGYL